LDALGNCAVRVNFIPAAKGSDSLTFESFQPSGAECIQRFGTKQYKVLGAYLKYIEEGLQAEVVPQRQRVSTSPY
jgi:hypothetical protein